MEGLAEGLIEGEIDGLSEPIVTATPTKLHLITTALLGVDAGVHFIERLSPSEISTVLVVSIAYFVKPEIAQVKSVSTPLFLKTTVQDLPVPGAVFTSIANLLAVKALANC